MKFKNIFLSNYIKEAPLPLAIERSFECKILSKQEFKRPILDIGCGEGLFAYILFDEKIDVGIDPNKKELKRAKHYGMYKNLIQCYANKINKPDKSFNTIFSNSAIEHIKDIKSVLKESYRLLADDGVIYFTVPTNYFDKYSIIYQILNGMYLKKYAEKYRIFFNKFWKHYHYYDKKGWIQLFERNGFKVEKSHGYCSKKACSFNNIMAPFSFFPFLFKKLFNKWYLCKTIRYVLSFFYNMLFDSKININQDLSKGGIIFFKLKKIL